MRRGLVTRVERLEGRDKQGHLRAHVVYLRPDGLPEHPEDFEAAGPIICLPRKAPSAEAWVAQCAARFQHRAAWQAQRAAWFQEGRRDEGVGP
jgi:hypothetical protein